MRQIIKVFILFFAEIFIFYFSGCKSEEITIVHEVTYEDNAYIRGTTSGAGYVNLMEQPQWVANRSSIKEVTNIKVQYRVTRNRTPTDVTLVVYFGKSQADIYLGNVFLAQGETHSELKDLAVGNSYPQLIDLILRDNAFWYSVQGNTSSANVDLEPVRITIYGTFEIVDTRKSLLAGN